MYNLEEEKMKKEESEWLADFCKEAESESKAKSK